MANASPVLEIGQKIVAGTAAIDEIAEFVPLHVPDAVHEVNTLFSPRQLIKRDNTVEPLPTDKRQLSSYRTRLGTMLEYALSTHIDKAFQSVFGIDLRLTFAVAHEYPDFYVRDAVLSQRVRIEVKAVDVESDKQAARFDVLGTLIQGDKDVVVIVAWEWVNDVLGNGTACVYPQIFSFVVVPASELAGERDTSVVLRGGRVDPDKILVPKKNSPGELTLDKGNAGKVLRLVHKTRKADPFVLSAHNQFSPQQAAEYEKRNRLRFRSKLRGMYPQRFKDTCNSLTASGVASLRGRTPNRVRP